MEAETVDYIEWKTGTRAEGDNAFHNELYRQKLKIPFSSSIGIAILGITGYIVHEEGNVIRNAQTNWALFLLTTLVPAIGYLLMLIPMHFYNITGEKSSCDDERYICKKRKACQREKKRLMNKH